MYFDAYYIAFSRKKCGRDGDRDVKALQNSGIRRSGASCSQASTAAFRGQMKASANCTRRGVDAARRLDAKDRAAFTQAMFALRLQFAGDSAARHREPRDALAISDDRTTRGLPRLHRSRWPVRRIRPPRARNFKKISRRHRHSVVFTCPWSRRVGDNRKASRIGDSNSRSRRTVRPRCVSSRYRS